MTEVMTKIVIKHILKGYLMVNNSFTQSVRWSFREKKYVTCTVAL